MLSSLKHDLDPVDMYAFKCIFFVMDTAIVHTYTMTENATFRKRSPESIFYFSITMTSHFRSHSWRYFYSRVQNGGYTLTLLSFILGLISSLIACFQINLSLLAIRADDLGRRGDIRQLALSISKLKPLKTTRRSSTTQITFLAFH